MSRADYQRWICEACGFIYDEAKGDPDSGLVPGTRYQDIPDDWLCPLCGMRKSELRLLPNTPVVARPSVDTRRPVKAASKSRGGDDYVVIVGAGVAGWSVAEALRRADSGMPVLLVSACPGVSYPKPALSTALAQGKTADELVLQDAVSKAAELGIELRTETRVIKVDTAQRRLVTSKGAIRYHKLVLALGGSQRDLPLQGDAADQILKVNDLLSYRRLRRQLDAGATRVTILGAGLIGCEFAEDLSSAGFHVDVVDPAERPLASLLPAAMSRTLQQRLEDKGVVWHLGETLDRLDRNEACRRATLSSGEAYETDVAISAAGLMPQTALAEKMGLKIDGGIWTDNHMRSSHEHVFAIGDCAAVQGTVYGYIEPILRQARAIAGAIVHAEQPFQTMSPLVQIKTPSFPLTICPPPTAANGLCTEQSTDGEGCRVDYRQGGALVGFVLADKCTADAAALYRSIQSVG